MVVTATQVGTIDANAGGRQRNGLIVREGRRFVYSIDGQTIDSAPTLAAAAHQLADALRRDLPRAAVNNWGVAVRCGTRPDLSLAIGNVAGGGGGGGAPDPCVLKVLRAFERSDRSLAAALEAAARLLADCCD